MPRTIVLKIDGDTRPLDAKAGASLRRLKNSVTDFNKLFKGQFENFGGNTKTSTTNGRRAYTPDTEIRKAQADIRRYQQEQARSERDLTRQIEREAKAQRQARTSEMRRAANETIREIDRMQKAEDEAPRKRRNFSSAFKGGAVGGFIGGAMSDAAQDIKQFAIDSAKLDASLDKLTRFTATLDKNFQTPAALEKFQSDIEKLSTQIPHNADDIAKASFTIKSAYQDLIEPELIQFLREFGIAAAGSNTDIASHAENVVALAKQYGIAAKELPRFNALIASSFGQALASDSQVAQGFNQVLNSAKAVKQPIETLIAAMSTLQGASNNAAGNTTLLLNVFSKLTDAKYQEGFKNIGIEVFDTSGQFRDLTGIINDMVKVMDGLSDKGINEKFGFLKDQQAREGFLTLARNAQAFNKQIADGANLNSYRDKTNLMLNSTEARWKRFWANVENGQRQFGSNMSDYLLSIFDQQTAGSQIEAFFGNLTLLVGKGVTGLFTGLHQIGAGIGFSVWEWLGGDPAEIEKRRQDYQKQYDDAFLWFDKQRAEFNQKLKEEDLDYFDRIIKSKDADEKLKSWALDQWSAIKDGMKEGSTSTTQIVKQSSNELKTSLESLSKNTTISADLRNKLKEEAKKLGTAVKDGVDSSVPIIDKATKDLQAALNKLLNDQRISTNLKEAIKKELAGFSKSVKDSRPEITKSGNTLGAELSNSVFFGVNQNKQKVNSAVSTIITPQTDKFSKVGQNLGVNFSAGITAGILSYKPNVVSATFSMFQTGAMTTQARTSGFNIGANLGGGMLQGMNSKLGEIRTLSTLMGRTAEQGLNTQLQIKSPSRIAIIIGEFFAEGFGIGIKNKTQNAAAQAKNLANETIKSLQDAIKEFNKLAGASPEVVQGIQATNRINDAVSAQQEIIKMRSELSLNLNSPMPSNIAETESELAYLQRRKQEAADWQTQLDEITEGYKKLQETIEQDKADFAEKLAGMKASGDLEILNLEEQIELTGVVNELKRYEIQSYFDIERLRLEMKNDGFGAAQIEEAEAILEAEQDRRHELLKTLELRKQMAEADSFGKELEKELFLLRNGGRELTEYQKTLEKINDELKDISPEQKQRLLDLSAEIDAVKELNRQHAELKDFFQETFTYVFDGDFAGLAQNFADRIRESFIDKLSDFFATNILGFDPKSTGNPVVDEQKKTNRILEKIAGVFGVGGGVGSIFSGGLSTPPFNPNGGGFSFGGSSGGYGTRTGDIVDGVSQVFAGDKGRGDLWSNIKNTFSTKEGGIFAPRGGSKLGGIAGGIADIASVVGGMIGGKWGNALSLAGTGMSIGSAFGPWGAAIGAAAGFVAGLFMGDPKRKVDKKENLPKLQQGFKDAFKEFSDLISDVTALRVDPDSAMGRGRELRAQIASGFGIEFQSKKYKKQSQELIKRQLAAIDAVPGGLMEELKRAVEIAKAANERDRRILPEFASGVFMDSGFASQYGDFKKRNGLMPGRFTGRDSLPSMLAPGEMVLNPYQMQRIRAAAGFDVFAFSGVPNYPRNVQGFADGTFVAPPTTGNISLSAQPVSFNFNGNIILEGFTAEPGAKAYLETEEGERKVINIINKRNKNFEVDPIKKKS